MGMERDGDYIAYSVSPNGVSISYMGMEQQHLVDIRIITSKYGYVKIK